jgi:hypothetical protein
MYKLEYKDKEYPDGLDEGFVDKLKYGPDWFNNPPEWFKNNPPKWYLNFFLNPPEWFVKLSKKHKWMLGEAFRGAYKEYPSMLESDIVSEEMIRVIRKNGKHDVIKKELLVDLIKKGEVVALDEAFRGAGKYKDEDYNYDSEKGFTPKKSKVGFVSVGGALTDDINKATKLLKDIEYSIKKSKVNLSDSKELKELNKTCEEVRFFITDYIRRNMR